MKLRNVGALSLTLFLATTGCDKLKGSSSEADNQGVPAVSEAELNTMGHYAKGFNELIGKPHECLDEYFKKVPEQGPEEGKKYTLFPRHSMATTALSTAKTQFEEASKSASDKLKHLDTLAKAALADMEQIVPTFAEAHKYYDAESFKDDQGAKGKELHQQITKLAGSYRSNMDKLETALSEVERQQTLAELKKYEKDKGYSYWFRSFNFEANQLLKATDAPRYAKAFAEFEKSYTDLKGFVAGKGDTLNATFKAYVDQAERFHSTAIKASRAFAEPEPDTDAVSALQNTLIDNYNALVSVTNSMQELEANDLLK